MFLKKKKGSVLVATYVILIVITVLGITFLSGTSTKVWRMFFPSEDKSTLKAFDTVYDTLAFKTLSTKDYDSTALNVYLKKGYNILLFKGYNAYYSASGNTQFYLPEECELGKVCLCLYKDIPQLGIVGEDKTQEKLSSKNLVKCRILDKVINFDSKYQPIYLNVQGVVRIGADENPYNSYIIAKRTVYPQKKGDEKKDYIYILENNETNKLLDMEWSIPVCKTINENDLCYGKKSGDIVKAIDEFSRDKIYNYCTHKEDPKYKSLAVLCEYPPVGDDCIPDCTEMESTELCKYNSCGEYNKLTRNINDMVKVRYISADDDYIQYSLCEIDNAFCDVNKDGIGCSVNTWQVYACKNSDNGMADDPMPMDSKDEINEDCTPPWSYIVDEENNAIDCKITFLEYNTNKIQFYENNIHKSLITSYDITNEKCKAHMDEYFYDKTTILTCRQGKDVECKQFLDDKKRSIRSGYDCELKVVRLYENSGKEVFWLTHYSTTDDDCKKEINSLFTPVSICGPMEEAVITASRNN